MTEETESCLQEPEATPAAPEPISEVPAAQMDPPAGEDSELPALKPLPILEDLFGWRRGSRDDHRKMLWGLALGILALALLSLLCFDRTYGEIFRPFLWIAGAGMYFVPGIYAYHIKHPQWQAIVGLNIIAGWTVLGWIAAMTWALVVPRDKGTG